MANSTLLPDSDKRESDKNESDKTFNDTFNVAQGLKDLERHANGEGRDNSREGSGRSSSQQARDDEQKGSAINSKFTGDSAYGGNRSPRGRRLSRDNIRAILKKRGVSGLLVTLVLGGGLAGFTLGGPSIVIVQIRQVFVKEANTQLSYMQSRYVKIFGLKLQPSKGDVCAVATSIRCRESTLSDKQVADLDKAGVKVDETATDAEGRVKAASLTTDDGTVITGDTFDDSYNSDSSLRTGLKDNYNPEFEGLDTNDPAMVQTEKELGVSKKPVLDGTQKDDDARTKALQENTKNGVKVAATPSITCDSSGKCTDASDNKQVATITEPDGSEASAAVADEVVKDAAGEAEDITSGAETVAADGVKVATTGLDTAANAIKVTGWVDNACAVYKSIQALGYAAKTVRSVQLARYVMAYFSFSDKIMAGDSPSSGDVAYYGKMVTSVVSDLTTAGVKTLGAATDSPAYRRAAYGDKTTLGIYSTEFLAGGGLTGSLIDLTSTVRNIITAGTGIDPNKVCGFLANPFVAGASAVVGIGTLLIPGVDIAFGALDGAKAALGVTLQIGAVMLPGMLKNIVAGMIVDKNTVGYFAGEALGSGAGGFLGTVSHHGGGAALTPTQAVSYTGLADTINAQNAEDDRLALNPLDASNPNTFLGSIVSSLTPYIAKMSSLTGVLNSVSSIVSGSLGSIISPVTKAATTTTTDDFTQCQDAQYRKLNLATDPYCNIIYGIAPEYLNEDPIAVLDALGDENVDPNTGDPVSGSDYAKFVGKCISNSQPPEESDDPDTDSAGCALNDKTKNYYLAWIDNRVQSGMDRNDKNTTVTASSGMFYDPTDTSGEYQTADATDTSTTDTSAADIQAALQAAKQASIPTPSLVTPAAIIEPKQLNHNAINNMMDLNKLFGVVVPKRYA